MSGHLNLIHYLKTYSELAKIKITAFVALTTAFGYVSYNGTIDLKLFYSVLGILLLACGSAALNHYQEKDFDLLMERTKGRPIPAGKISPQAVLFYSSILVILGSLILILLVNVLAFGLAVLNLIWYNVVYTLLKRKTPFAIIPGSLVGAVPPVVGWTAAGGHLFDPQIIIISFFLFIWQIPHFWLLLLLFNDDYVKAGFPTLTRIFEKEQLSRITFIWIVATAVTGTLIPLFGLVQEFWINISLFISSIWLSVVAFRILIETADRSIFKFTFRHINFFVLVVVTLVSIDRILF